MRCSVIILNWNGAEMLRRYLPSVVAYTPADCEVIVADNGSTDESLCVLSQEFPAVRTIILDKNYGFADGYNRAIAQIDSDYTVLLNSDVEVTTNWLTPMLTYMDLHAEVAAVQPKIHSWLKRDYFEHAGAAGGYIDIFCYPFCRGRLLNKAEKDAGQYDTIADVLWTSGACMCVRTQVFKEAGGLDNDFFAHMEEIDLCWRLNCRGYRLVCLPDSTVYHLGGGALGYENPRKTYLNFRNNLLMIYKNLPTKMLWYTLAVRFVLDCVAALQFLFTGKPQQAKAVIQARIDHHKMKKHFVEKRAENLRKTVVPYPSGIRKRFILWDFYVLHKQR